MSTNLQPDEISGFPATRPRDESVAPAVSWAAILAGAIAAAATALILIALGAGIGLASVSPWPNSGVSVTTFSVLTAIWLIVVQWLSAMMGGYIAGRLRVKWAAVHTHEVFFRDTAHGFITWSLSTVIGAVLLASATGATAGKTAEAASSAASGLTGGVAAAAGTTASVTPYDVDRLLRPATPDTDPAKGDGRAETVRILARGASGQEIPADDRDYVARVVAARTGISEAEAQKRVDQVISTEQTAELKARQAADEARKATAAASIFTALSMLIGAFIACASAALGGRLRDLHP